ncbi:hypothetical protein NG798_27720, partial [Ancylothrix sp. C2]|uniref:hypothetical protein n=1 Tax=Ancylothrix sp. D3o TaxID=2953691 RepID=UPI0021BA4CD5
MKKPTKQPSTSEQKPADKSEDSQEILAANPEQKPAEQSQDSQEILAANLAKAMLKVKTKSDIQALKEWSNAEQWQAAQQLLTPEQR